ncbi:MAG: hypothetical protein IJI58_04415 [Bacilli bacterium]|nr:hypothetical protein [Bacilli bacterium]
MRKILKSLLTFGLILILVGLIMIRKEDLITIIHTYLSPNSSVKLGDKNDYYRHYDFTYVQNTNDFSPTNIQDILNIYYTVINAGKTEFSFYCPKEYSNCLEDVQTLAKDQGKLSDINNFVHPYNGFSHIETEYNSLGKVFIRIDKSYSDDDIKLIDKKVDELYPQLVKDNKSVEDNIKSVHDYIINHTKYDSERSDKKIVKYRSDIAYGPLYEGYGICGGYTDLMELFLERMKVKSFKVSSELHVWNAIYINDKWKHLDLTWDDPVAADGKQYLEHNYFLIDTDKLLNQEKTQHNFDQEIYSELKGTN